MLLHSMTNPWSGSGTDDIMGVAMQHSSLQLHPAAQIIVESIAVEASHCAVQSSKDLHSAEMRPTWEKQPQSNILRCARHACAQQRQAVPYQ